mmetsp:Transcript_17278/g.39966  ORF Transcript_17278/g.39966 Transcript_17278/m.39966 type:complete len:301 (-) Transcript_17278:903-1805(-)
MRTELKRCSMSFSPSENSTSKSSSRDRSGLGMEGLAFHIRSQLVSMWCLRVSVLSESPLTTEYSQSLVLTVMHRMSLSSTTDPLSPHVKHHVRSLPASAAVEVVLNLTLCVDPCVELVLATSTSSPPPMPSLAARPGSADAFTIRLRAPPVLFHGRGDARGARASTPPPTRQRSCGGRGGKEGWRRGTWTGDSVEGHVEEPNLPVIVVPVADEVILVHSAYWNLLEACLRLREREGYKGLGDGQPDHQHLRLHRVADPPRGGVARDEARLVHRAGQPLAGGEGDGAARADPSTRAGPGGG